MYLAEQTHQSQSQGEGYGIETRVCIHRTGANHKGRDAPDAPPLLVGRACALTSIPLKGDRWRGVKYFIQQGNEHESQHMIFSCNHVMYGILQLNSCSQTIVGLLNAEIQVFHYLF